MPTADRAAVLCGACGACCDGTFFVRGVLRSDELARARAQGLEVADDGRHFRQPCREYRGDRCAIYRRRPAACARYRCRLLGRLEAGEIDLAHGLAVVEGLREAAAEVRDGLGVAGQPLLAACDAFVDRTGLADERRRHGELLLAVTSFVHRARKHFGVRDADCMG